MNILNNKIRIMMEDYEKKHKEEVERATQLWEGGDITREQLEYIFPELKESEGEKIRKVLIGWINLEPSTSFNDTFDGFSKEQILAWLEKQSDKCLVNFDEAEQEKYDFVSGQYIECRASFNEFKEDNSYWLEYLGDDNYIGRSDNILNQKFHITPRQLFTLFTWQHCPKDNNVNEETNAPTEYGKYVDECLNEASKHFFSDGEDAYSVADLFYAGVRCGKSWFERQSEQKKTYDVCDSSMTDNKKPPYGEKRDFGYFEEKPADKVEPKFHEGDWTVSNLDGKARQILEVHYDEYNNYYVVENDARNIEEYDRLHHLWNIQDAKDGDVLVTTFEEDNMILMYHSMCTIDTINVYCCLDNKFVCWNLGVFNAEDVKPATKEQRDLLFSEMKEAVYEWLKETHQLKKIAQKPYGQRKECSYCQFNYAGECKGSCAMKRSEQKHAWSEEDEDYINDLIKYFSQNEKLKNTKEDIVIWLKSIKRPYTNNKFT